MTSTAFQSSMSLSGSCLEQRRVVSVGRRSKCSIDFFPILILTLWLVVEIKASAITGRVYAFLLCKLHSHSPTIFPNPKILRFEVSHIIRRKNLVPLTGLCALNSSPMPCFSSPSVRFVGHTLPPTLCLRRSDIESNGVLLWERFCLHPDSLLYRIRQCARLNQRGRTLKLREAGHGVGE